MNACTILAGGAIELYFYGELAAGERQDVEDHLKACAECRDALDELHAIRAALAARPAVTAPPGSDWAPLMSRLALAVRQEPPRLAAAAPAPAAIRRRPMPAYFAMAALLTLVTASIAYLARQPAAIPAGAAREARVDPVASHPEAAPAFVDASAQPADPAFVAVSEQHFERSKLVILGLTARNAATSSSSDWAYERQLAGSLLDDTRLYKQAAEARGLGALAGVMSDLELVLLQTSLADQQDAATLDRLQRLIRKRDLVSKMRAF